MNQTLRRVLSEQILLTASIVLLADNMTWESSQQPVMLTRTGLWNWSNADDGIRWSPGMGRYRQLLLYHFSQATPIYNVSLLDCAVDPSQQMTLGKGRLLVPDSALSGLPVYYEMHEQVLS